MTTPAIQPFDSRSPIIVNPREIQAGDWMRDLGTLRQVESVEAIAEPVIRGTLVRFTNAVDGQYRTLRVSESVSVTVWRPMPPQGSESRPEAVRHAVA